MKNIIKEFFFGKKKRDETTTPDTYDNITSKDIPEDEAFNKKYEDHKKYAFTLSKVEYLRYKQFVEDHRKCRVRPDGTHRYGAIGGGLVVSFMGTGLGNIIKCKCETCGKSVDITDESCW